MALQTSMFLAEKLNCTSGHDKHSDVNLIAQCVRQAPAANIQVFGSSIWEKLRVFQSNFEIQYFQIRKFTGNTLEK